MKRTILFLALIFSVDFLFGQAISPDVDLQINLDNIQSQLNGRKGEFDFMVPDYDPNFVFHLLENDVMADNIKAQFPTIRSFFVMENNGIVGSMTFYDQGLWLDYNYKGKALSIYPDFSKGARGQSKIQFERRPVPFGMCATDHSGARYKLEDISKVAGSRADFVKKREYRIAIVATGEWFAGNGGTTTSANAAIVASVNGITAIYARQLGIFFKLTGSFVFQNAATDPFTPDNLPGAPTRPTQAGTEVPKQFAKSSYDIGHVLHVHDTGDNWSTGGVARLSSVCDDSESGGQVTKASAWSGSFNTNGFDWHSLFAHEIGHQFSMTHTFNGTGDSCTDAISTETAVEIGSGTTIMSYNGLCLASNNVPANGGEADNYFHYVSHQNCLDYITNEIPNCVVAQTLTNHNPTGTANPCGVPSYKMPKNTPFYMKGNATDEDGDVLYYSWDEFDEDGSGIKTTQGSIGTNAGTKPKAPLMKCIPPSLSNERYFPTIATVVNGNNSDPFQVLPNVSRNFSVAFSARDNKPTGGGIYYEERVIAVDGTGPLTVDFPNANNTFNAGDSIVVKWNTNGSDALCSKASIFLSIDGGLTYPITLAADVAYNLDSLKVGIPGFVNNTRLARVKISCEDFDCFKFYDISNTNFSINSICSAPSSIICPSDNVSFDKGSPSLDLTLKNVTGTSVTSFSKRITNTSPSGPIIVYNTTKTGCTTKGNTNNVATIISVSKTGTYNFIVDTDFANGFGFVTLVNADTYNPASACNSFIASSGTDAGAQGVSASTAMSATLTECTNYRLIFYNFETYPINTVISSVSGPGIVMEQPSTPNADFSYTYIAVRNTNNIIAAVSNTADFRTLGPGLYTIYGIAFKSGGTTPPNITDFNNYIGKTYNSFYINGDCYLQSINSFELEVKGSCSLDNASLGVTGACDPMNNSFLQPITLSFTASPGGKINAGGQLFDITTSPQTINYSGISNGLSTNIDVFFEAEPDCKYPLTILSPKNCCPFESGVEVDQRGCQGQSLTIEANKDLGIYNWFDPSGALVSTTSTLTASTAGKYRLVISSLTGCEKSQDINVTFEATPTVALPSDVTICEGVDFLITATTNATFMEWYRNDTLVQSGANNVLKVNTKGSYVVKAGNSVLCQVSDEIKVSTKPSPKPNLGKDQNICEGSNAILSIDDVGTIQWFYNNVLISGQSGKSITVKDEGIYKVVVKAANDCQNEDIINVNVFALPTVNAGPDVKFCDGKDATINATSSSQIFEWQKDGVSYPAVDLTFNTNEPGKYKIIAQNEIGCKVADSLIVTKNPLPTVNLGDDKVGCIGSEVILAGPTGAGLNYQWQRNGVNVTGGQQLTVTTVGVYSLIVTDANTCSNIDMVNVDFKPGPSVSLNETAIEFCEGESFDIVATTTATKIEWLKNGTKINGETKPTLKITEAGSYTIKVSGNVGGTSECTVEELATATINPKLTLNVKDTTACEGEIITIDAKVNAAKYTWSLNGTPLASTKTYKPTTAGTYKLEVETNKGCKTSDDIVVTFSARPNIDMPPTGQFCKGESLNVNASSNGTAFKWLKGTSTIPNATTKTLNINSAGIYILEASFNGACPKKDTITVAERALPVVKLGTDVVLCPNDSITIDGQNTGSKYVWSTGDTTKTIKIKNPGVAKITDIRLTVTNQFGCKASDTLKVTSQPKINITLASSAPGVCGGDSVILSVKGGAGYKWTGPLGTFTQVSPDSIIVFPSATAIYTVTSSDDCPSNADTAFKEIKLFPLGTVSAGNDTCVVKGRTIRLKASGGASYVWKADPTIVKGATTASPEVGPTVETTYRVSIKDANGCVQEDSVAVCIIEDPIKLIKEINMITPNGDGSNDNLEFKGLEAFPDNTLTVYNRWGNIVFEKSGYQSDSERFDGTRNGEELPADTYYYVLTFESNTFKSSLTILRANK